MPDAYGIPENMFGPVPEEFYGLIGRVVMVCSLLEIRLLDLLTALERVPQDTHAGKPGSELIKLCRGALADYERGFGVEAEAALADAQALLEARHAVVHSAWPGPTVERAWGWRPVRRNRRTDPADSSATVDMSDDEGRRIVRDAAALVSRLGQLRERARTQRGSA